MTGLQLFWGFFLANILGYGGGPASIPLLQTEVVSHYGWLTLSEFGQVFAVANALPGPIMTKMAAYVGYHVWGWPGVVMALLGTVAPTAAIMVGLIQLLHRWRSSDTVRGMTLWVQPVVTVLMAVLTWGLGTDAVREIGWGQTLGIASVAGLLLVRFRLHPALVIVMAFAYGGLVLSHGM